MKKLLYLMLLLSTVTWAQERMPWHNKDLTRRDQLLYNLKYVQTETDTFEFNYVKSPGLAFLLSAVLPGAGELYAHATYRAIAFFSIEAISWGVYLDRKSVGSKIEKQYKRFANNNWSLYNWYYNAITSPYYEDYFGLTRRGFGSHSIWIEYNGTEYEANEDTLNAYIPTWAQILYNEKDLPYSAQTLRPVRSRDFYENIGKYDQFATGWYDFDNSLVDTTKTRPVKNSSYREKYLNDRYKSNQAFKMATNFVTVIMFNHLISAFHAQIAAKQYRPPEIKDISWHWSLLADYRYRFPIRGVQLALAF